MSPQRSPFLGLLADERTQFRLEFVLEGAPFFDVLILKCADGCAVLRTERDRRDGRERREAPVACFGT